MTVSTIAQSQLNQQQSSSPAAANVKQEQQTGQGGAGASPHHHMFSPAQQFAQQQFSPQVQITISKIALIVLFFSRT